MSSKSFGTMHPLKPHLLQQTGGLAAEIKDVRDDIETAFLTSEARTGFPSLEWLDMTTGSPDASGGPLKLCGSSLLQGQTCDTVTLGSGTAGVVFKSIIPGDSGIKVEIVQGAGAIDSLFTPLTKSWYAFTTTNFDTVVQAKTAGEAGDRITVKTMPDGSAKAGLLEESGYNVILHYKPATSTVTDMEALIGASALIEVKTAGTGANVLAAPADTVAQTNLHSGGYGLLTVTLAAAGSTATQVVTEVNAEATCQGVIFTKVLSGGGGTVLVASETAMTGGTGVYASNKVYIAGVECPLTEMETPWTDAAVYVTTPDITSTPGAAATDYANIVVESHGIKTAPLTVVLT